MLLESSLRFEPAAASDLEQLVQLRIEAMRESLERIGRFDPARARERFSGPFAARPPLYPAARTGARHRGRSVESPVLIVTRTLETEWKT